MKQPEYRDRYPRTLEEAFGPYTSHHIIDPAEEKMMRGMRPIYAGTILGLVWLATLLWR